MSLLRKYPRKTFWRLYCLCLAASLVLDVYWLYKQMFTFHFAFQKIPQFFALFGLVGCVLLILIAKGIGRLIVVDENYYDDKTGESQ